MIDVDLEKPLDPNLDYFDATPSIETLAKHCKLLHNAYRRQLEINMKVIDTLRGLNERVGELEQARSKIITLGRSN